MTCRWHNRFALAAILAIALNADESALAAENSYLSAECLQRPAPACVLDAAMRTIHAIGQHPDRLAELMMPRLLDGIVQAQIATGNLRAAYSAADAMKGLVSSDIYEAALSSIAHAEARVGNVERALRLIDSTDAASRVSVLTTIAETHMKTGNASDARRTIASALEAMQTIRDDPLRVLEMTAVAKVMAGLGDERTAQRMLQEAREIADRLPKMVFRSFSLSAIASAHVDLGDVDSALSIARSNSGQCLPGRSARPSRGIGSQAEQVRRRREPDR